MLVVCTGWVINQIDTPSVSLKLEQKSEIPSSKIAVKLKRPSVPEVIVTPVLKISYFKNDVL